MPADLIKKLLYGSGLLGLYHRWRNARTLTVIMYHRVLDPRDKRWQSCDPDYTLAADLFGETLRFFSRHYHVVSTEQVLAARRGGAPLPPRALLITFDDGWQDNVEFALPQLQAQRLPGLLFVVADAIGQRQPFYQERIVAAWRLGRLGACELADLLRSAGFDAPEVNDNDIGTLRRVIAALEAVPRAQRMPLLESLAARLDDGERNMVTADELHTLRRGGVEIGLHGKTHEPMTRAPDLDAELSGARRQVGAQIALPPATMSFPHGQFDAGIAQRARDAGYELVFTSVPAINPTAGGPGWLLGRLGFETDAVADRNGHFRPDLLALYLFRKPRRALAAS